MPFNDQFPTFPLDAFPAIPDGFEDTSWRNDACPCVEGRGFIVWIDWPDIAERECGGLRFTVTRLADEWQAVAFESDDWAPVLAFITKEA